MSHGHGAGAGRMAESPLVMTVPLALLAVGALSVGWLGSPWMHQAFFEVLGLHHGHEGLDLGLLVGSLGIAGGGAGLAWAVGVRHLRLLPAVCRPLAEPLVRAAAHQYYVDKAYDRWIIEPFLALTRSLSRFDLRVIDRAVDGTGQAGWSLGKLKDWFDRTVVDRLVDGVAEVAQSLSRLGRRLQTGLVHHYLLGLVGAVVVLLLWLR